jgi:hypothetical protein
VFEEKAVNVGEACSPTGFESSFEGGGVRDFGGNVGGGVGEGDGEGVAEDLGSCADTGPGAFRVTQAIAAAAAISGIAAGRRTYDRR